MKRGESRVTGQPATEVGRGRQSGEDGQEERESQMSKGEKEEQFRE
jgi:hypothetical protein